jgi:hypothetical protein
MTFDELRAEVERVAQEAEDRDRRAFASYVRFCEQRGIAPASFERWVQIRDIHAF